MDEKAKQELSEVHNPALNKNKGRIELSFLERVNLFKSRKEHKLTQLRKEMAEKKEIEETKELTFQPVVLNKAPHPRTYHNATNNRPEIANHQFLECSFQPKLNEHSKKIGVRLLVIWKTNFLWLFRGR